MLEKFKNTKRVETKQIIVAALKRTGPEELRKDFPTPTKGLATEKELSAFARYGIRHDAASEVALYNMMQVLFRSVEELAKEWTFYVNPTAVHFGNKKTFVSNPFMLYQCYLTDHQDEDKYA